MSDSDPKPAFSPARLAGHLRLAGAAILWERLWPALWPAIAVAGSFLVVALFDLPALLPGWLHVASLVVIGALFLAALLRAARLVRLPDRAVERRRIEQASGFSHRPLTHFEDRLSGAGDDPAIVALWQAHRQRMIESMRQMRVGWPEAGLVRRDPLALRAALALLLLLAVIDAGRDWPQRLERALVPSFAPGGATEQASLDIWVTPPEYTGLPPQFLPATTPELPIAVPTGSTVLAQVHGGRAPPQLKIDGKPTDFAPVDEHNFKGGATLTAGYRLAVEQDGHALGSWPIRIVPDLPPTIEFAKPPQTTRRQVMRVEYDAHDDYGIEGAQAIITRPGDSGEPIRLDLPLPGPHLKEAHDATFNDLTAHPWAGLPVDIRLRAADALGQTGESDTLRITLPERQFHHPVARAIIEQRKQLTLDPAQRDVVAETLSDLSLKPSLFADDPVVFLALRTSQARLLLDKAGKSVAPVQQLLWETAVRIEDGRASLVQRDLRDAMKALQDALARNAPDAEIEQLMHDLQQAIDKYLEAMAQNMDRQNGDQDQQPLDPSRMLSRQDLQRMLDRARELARTGSREAARDMLSQLQEMLENMRMARPGQMRGGQGQAMRQMQEMMRRQQQLLDRSFRQSRQSQQGQPGQQGQQGQQGQRTQQGQGGQMGEGQDGGGDLAGEQEGLRRELDEMMRQLGEQSGDIPQSLGRAERAMRGAADALKHGQPSGAIAPQTEALDQLQQAARSMVEQMMGQMGDGSPNDSQGDRDGPRQTDRDPFGRLNNQDHANGGIDNDGRLRMGDPTANYALEKAKGILDELRRRAGERSRPEIERDYIDRLLKQF